MNTPAPVIVMPGSPSLVPQLVPLDVMGAEMLTALRQCVADVMVKYQPAGIDIVGSQDARWYTARTGDFGAWGAPEVKVGGGNHLAELVARFMLQGVEAAQGLSITSRGTLGTLNPDALTVVCLDGSAGLNVRAPLTLLEQGPWAHQWCTEMAAGRQPAAPAADRLREAGVIEPDLWLELAGIAPRTAQLLAADDSLGVGRYAALWEVEL